MNDQPITLLLAIGLPDVLDSEIVNRHAALAKRWRKLESTYSELDAERRSLAKESDPFAAAMEYRTKMVAAWREESAIFMELASLAPVLQEAIRQCRLEVAGKLTVAANDVRRKHFAEHLEEPASYVIANDPTVADLDVKLANLRSHERRWRSSVRDATNQAMERDRRVAEAIGEFVKSLGV